MMFKKAFPILTAATLLTLSAHAFAESCVPKYEAEEKVQKSNAGSAAINMITLGTVIFEGSIGSLKIQGPTLKYFFAKKNENAPIVEEVKVLTLYRQAKKCEGGRCKKTSDMDVFLRSIVEKGLNEYRAQALSGSKEIPQATLMKIPDTIITMMESGYLCREGNVMNAGELFKELAEAHDMSDVQIQNGSSGS